MSGDRARNAVTGVAPGGLRQVTPRRRQAAAGLVGSGPAESQPNAPQEPDFTAVSIDSLRLVLDGLRRLS